MELEMDDFRRGFAEELEKIASAGAIATYAIPTLLGAGTGFY